MTEFHERFLRGYGAKLLFWPFVLRSCMEMKEFGQEGACTPSIRQCLL